ncbi:MAG: hypothetical protein U0869_25505 [Chloroflexota bacterium]
MRDLLAQDPGLTAQQVDERLRAQARLAAQAGTPFAVPDDVRTIEGWVDFLRPAVQTAPWCMDLADPEAARIVLPVVAWLAETGRVLRQGAGRWVASLVRAAPTLGEPQHREFLFRLALGHDIAASVVPADDMAALTLYVACEPWLDGGRRYARAQARTDPAGTARIPYVVHLTSPALYRRVSNSAMVRDGWDPAAVVELFPDDPDEIDAGWRQGE